MMTQIDPNNTQAILIGASKFDYEDLPDLYNVKNNFLFMRSASHWRSINTLLICFSRIVSMLI